jgi:hypothetical protein
MPTTRSLGDVVELADRTGTVLGPERHVAEWGAGGQDR